MFPKYLDPSWKYTPAIATDIRKSIRAERRRLAALGLPIRVRSNRKLEKGR